MATMYATEEKFATLNHQFEDLKKEVTTMARQQMPIHLREQAIFRRLLDMGRLFLQESIQQSGPTHDREQAPTTTGHRLPYKGTSSRWYVSIFGEIKIKRARYLQPSGRYHYPLDARLELPRSKYSYLLQKWLEAGAVENNYRESAERFDELFGFSFGPNLVCRMTGQVSGDVESFYEQTAAPTAETEGECLAVGLDGKGVRLVKSERAEASAAEAPKARLGKGEKFGTKKEHGLKPRVKAIILDIIHATEYLWKAANALHGETGPARVQWLSDKLLDILQNNVGRVIGGLKQRLTKNDLSAATRRTLQQVITYFENHRHMMNYQTYLEHGYLISTGVVESACGSLVRDRMEQSGMRWTINGAKAILALRAVKKNGDWESFWNKFIETQTQKMYADSYLHGCCQYKKAA